MAAQRATPLLNLSIRGVWTLEGTTAWVPQAGLRRCLGLALAVLVSRCVQEPRGVWGQPKSRHVMTTGHGGQPMTRPPQ
jgi:hypothetical protein